MYVPGVHYVFVMPSWNAVTVQSQPLAILSRIAIIREGEKDQSESSSLRHGLPYKGILHSGCIVC